MAAEPFAQRTTPELRELPRMSLAETLRVTIENARRIDMRTPLQRQQARYGNAVRSAIGFLPMVNLFGPDANRLVLLDRDGIFSARKPWMAIMGRIFPN